MVAFQAIDPGSIPADAFLDPKIIINITLLLLMFHQDEAGNHLGEIIFCFAVMMLLGNSCYQASIPAGIIYQMHYVVEILKFEGSTSLISARIMRWAGLFLSLTPQGRNIHLAWRGAP